MAKYLVDIDDKALIAAKSELGTRTLKDTVNEELRRVAPRRDRRMARALDTTRQGKTGRPKRGVALTHRVDTSVLTRLRMGVIVRAPILLPF